MSAIQNQVHDGKVSYFFRTTEDRVLTVAQMNALIQRALHPASQADQLNATVVIEAPDSVLKTLPS